MTNGGIHTDPFGATVEAESYGQSHALVFPKGMTRFLALGREMSGNTSLWPSSSLCPCFYTPHLQGLARPFGATEDGDKES